MRQQQIYGETEVRVMNGLSDIRKQLHNHLGPLMPRPVHGRGALRPGRPRVTDPRPSVAVLSHGTPAPAFSRADVSRKK